MVKHSCPFENCTLTFSRPYRLRIHMQRHQGIKEFQCTHCKRGYHRQQHLKRHIAEAHQNQSRLEQPLFCNHCERQFNTAWGLRRHQIKIEKEIRKTHFRPYCCQTCSNKFYTTEDLERHKLRHERFKCNIPSCPLSSHQFHWSYYHRHMADYHSELLECEHCGEKFVKKSQLRDHIREHMPKFTCTQPGCNRTFTFAKNMAMHIVVGHGERKHKCNVVGCDWVFKYKICLDRHIKVHKKNGRIVPMANRMKKKEPKYKTAKKLATLVLKM